MKLFWACKDHGKAGNFGDIIPCYVLDRFNIKYEYSADLSKELHILGGSNLCLANNNTIIYGCGFAESNQEAEGKPKIISVRGELSRKMLLSQGIEVPKNYSDMANYLPYLYNPPIKPIYKYGFLPHFSDYKHAIDKHGDKYVIDICSGVEPIISELKKYEKIFTSSLHGIITCQLYGIKWVWCNWCNNIPGDEMKYHDYFTVIFDNYDFKLKPIQL